MRTKGAIIMKAANPDYCAKCPYKAGIIRTLANPCPQCKSNGYPFVKRSGVKTAPLDENHRKKI